MCLVQSSCAQAASLIFKRLSVTQFVTQNCEIRGLFAIEAPLLPTATMLKGTEIHASLEAAVGETNIITTKLIPLQVELQPIVDYATKLWNMTQRLNRLKQGHCTREVRVAGSFSGLIVTGVIDDLRFDEGGKLVVIDTKTVLNIPVPEWKQRLAYHQTLVYSLILQQMAQSSFDFNKHFVRAEFDAQMKWDKEIQHMFNGLQNLDDIYKIAKTAVDAFDLQVANTVGVDYIHQKSNYHECMWFDNDKPLAQDIVDFRLDLFNGKREPMAINADFITMCEYCQYKPSCPELGYSK